MAALALERVDRLPRWPRWAVTVVGIWLALVLANVLLDQHLGRHSILCLFRLASHLPCPTCGAGRCLLALAALDLAAALAANPLFLIAVVTFTIWLAMRLAFGVSWRLAWSPRSRRLALALLLGTVAANWAYLIAKSLLLR